MSINTSTTRIAKISVESLAKGDMMVWSDGAYKGTVISVPEISAWDQHVTYDIRDSDGKTVTEHRFDTALVRIEISRNPSSEARA